MLRNTCDLVESLPTGSRPSIAGHTFKHEFHIIQTGDLHPFSERHSWGDVFGDFAGFVPQMNVAAMNLPLGASASAIDN